MSVELPDGHELREGVPRLDEYLALREHSGLTPKREDQAESLAEGMSLLLD